MNNLITFAHIIFYFDFLASDFHKLSCIMLDCIAAFVQCFCTILFLDQVIDLFFETSQFVFEMSR